MMNAFPPKYLEPARESSGSEMPLMNVSEYLQHLFAIGIRGCHRFSNRPITTIFEVSLS